MTSQLYTIPPMTHELSRGWLPQPNASSILIDQKHAIMNQSDFEMLRDYTASCPSGVYEGKMWKTEEFKVYRITEGEHKGKLYSKPTGKWLLNWWDVSDDPNKCSHNTREIIIL